MPILYRADTRPPEEIFKTGFTPRLVPALFDKTQKNKHQEILKKFRAEYCTCITDDHNTEVIYWLHNVLRPGLSSQHSGDEGSPLVNDANPSYVVALTYNLSSSPIFPIDEEVSRLYIYAILLPEAKIPYFAKMRYGYSREERNELLDPFIITGDLAYDLHSLQTESIEYNGSPTAKSVEYQADILCAYEAFATSIDPSNIICATECIRSPVIPVPRAAEMTREAEFASIFIRPPFNRTFTCGDIVIENAKFDITDDRVNIKTGVIEYIRSLANQTLNTTSICAGLAGKTFHVPYSLPYPLPVPKPEVKVISTPDSKTFTPSFNMIARPIGLLSLAAIAYKGTGGLRSRKKARL